MPLLKEQILLWQFEHVLTRENLKSGGAMAPLAPLFTQALELVLQQKLGRGLMEDMQYLA